MISGYPEIQKSGNPEIRISGNPEIRKSGNPDFRISAYPDFQISGYPDFRKSGYPEIRIYGNPDIRIFSCPCLSSVCQEMLDLPKLSEHLGKKTSCHTSSQQCPRIRIHQQTNAVIGPPQCNRGFPGIPGNAKKYQNADLGGSPANVQYHYTKMSNGVPETSISDPPENVNTMSNISKTHVKNVLVVSHNDIFVDICDTLFTFLYVFCFFARFLVLYCSFGDREGSHWIGSTLEIQSA